ncbi:MAG: TlpA disulfide reductase family protein [Myxococcota bacterium]
MVWFALLACVPKIDIRGVEARVTELELADEASAARIAALESRVDELERTTELPPSADDEAAAVKLLADAKAAIEALRPDEAKSILAELASKYPTTRSGKASIRMSSELALVGSAAPALEVDRWIRGSPEALVGGSVQLYVFFEAWCPHCKREMPKLAETARGYRERGLRVVGLTKMTRDVTEEGLAQFLDEGKVDFPVGLEASGSMSERFVVSGIPAAAVVRDGVVVWRGHPALLTPAMLEGWLAR